MKKIITGTFMLCVFTIFQMQAAADFPYISGPGIDGFTYAKVGIEQTYTVKYDLGSGTSTTNDLIKWDIEPNDYEFIRADRSKASITIKWKREGVKCRIRAYNISIINSNNQTTSYTEVSTYVSIQSSTIGDVVITAPDKVLVNSTYNFNVRIDNTIADMNVSISGNDLIASPWVNTGTNVGYFPIRFSATGSKTVTVTASATGLTPKTASKNMIVYPNLITGEDTIAYNGQEIYRLVNAPSDNYTWYVPNGLQIVSGQGTSQVVIKHNGMNMGSGYIEVSFSGLSIRKNIAMGVPNIDLVDVTLGYNNTLWAYQTSRNECMATYRGVGTILEYEWRSSDWVVTNPLTTNYSLVYLKAVNPGCCPTANIVLSARNSVGWSRPILLGAQVNNSYSSPSYNIHNTSNNITISENITDNMNRVINNNLIAYELYHITNVSVAKKGTIPIMGGNIDISDMPKGIYIFSLVIDPETRQTIKIVK